MPSEGHLYAAAAPSLTTAISVAVAAGESLLTAAVLAIAGIYMTRSGFMGQEVTRGLAALQMRCLMPCLLFSRVLPAVSPRLLVLNWPMLLLPLAMVPIGLALGKLVALLSGSLVRPQDHWIVVCATAFPNSISLPTVLLTVVQEILYRGGAAVPPDGLVADPLVFVGFYQPVHMTLLWALGGWLLGVNMEQTPEEAAPPRPARGGGGASAASTTASFGFRSRRTRSDAETPACCIAACKALCSTASLAARSASAHSTSAVASAAGEPASSSTKSRSWSASGLLPSSREA